MKILFFTKYYFPHLGGVEKHTREVAERLVKKGHHVTVMTMKYDHKLPKKEIKRLLKLTKTGFFKSEISKRCKQNNYYQGINKLKEIHTKLKKQEFETIKIQENYFSLSAYISSIGAPENFTYFPIVNLLNKGKFKELGAYLPSLTANSKKDRDYIGKIKYGLKKALELPEPNLNLAQIEQSYTLINQIKGG